MIKDQGDSPVGDSKMTPLRPEGANLKRAADLMNVPVSSAPPAVDSCVAENIKAALKSKNSKASKPLSCRQELWLSFFFDGTGNNMEADLELLKHSNVARLYRIHRETDPTNGVFRFYIPGIGTYFKEIKDDGGSVAGNAFGALGQARLSHALEQFDLTLADPIKIAKSQINAIKEINIAVFGFSRGAALARAFVSLLIETRCIWNKSSWKLRSADAPIIFRFMGLFDTVASVGQPMSRNNTDYWNPAMSDVAGMIEERIEDYPDTSPVSLAFSINGRAGADPAPGGYAGHDSWGARMAIHESVKEVRHFIAAHEVRNSFPVDSISILKSTGLFKPAHFHETVYPGSHSDVGGGYAPGEGAKAMLPADNFCLIPLRHMYEYALQQGVPLLPITAPLNVQDFELSDDLKRTYNSYAKLVGTASGLGQLLNKHREVYFAWYFSKMKKKLKGVTREIALIEKYKQSYRSREKTLAAEVARLAKIESAARVKLDVLVRSQQMGPGPIGMGRMNGRLPTTETSALGAARKEYLEARDNRLKAEAKRNAVPNMEKYESMLELYEKQLEADVESIISALSASAGKAPIARQNLRPHYKALLKAYEDEIKNCKGLNDKDVSAFFELYIHDSLAGFAKDATLPSDPRVVYVGGDRKLEFAQNDALENSLIRLA